VVLNARHEVEGRVADRSAVPVNKKSDNHSTSFSPCLTNGPYEMKCLSLAGHSSLFQCNTLAY
jgi:hypothetical protein